MSRTYKDKPWKVNKTKKIHYWVKNVGKNIKEEQFRNRHKLEELTDSPPVGYIHKMLADRWNWD
jgi:hypothetical protein